MMFRDTPHFIIKKNLQKSKQIGIYFDSLITGDVLKELCQYIAGKTDFTYTFVDNNYKDEFLDKGYNKGRIALLHYQNEVSYISFSEREIGGRNSSVQSVATAFNKFYMNPHRSKKLYYYFLNTKGNAATAYQMLIYRLMKTIGFDFINAPLHAGINITAFSSIEDIMNMRKSNSSRNKSNNSTYITKSSINQYDIYGKTYGANKYETSLFCYSLSMLAKSEQNLILYEVLEGDLKELPEASLNVIDKMKNIKVIPIDMLLEKTIFEENDSLRSPRYIYNLLKRLGVKQCAFCKCEIPEIIQGAHIWPVASIKKAPALSFAERLGHAIDGENGIWLCENHHKMFDQGLLNINFDGTISNKKDLDKKHILFINEITTKKHLPSDYLSPNFNGYLIKRNGVSP